MADSVKIKAGTKANMPTLPDREFGWCRDEEALYIGTPTGNLKIFQVGSSVEGEVEELTKRLLGAEGGCARLVDTDADGQPDTLFIADHADPEQAQHVWRFNHEGWGASESGYSGPYVIGANFETGIVADFITAGTLSADLIKAGTLRSADGTFSLNLETGEILIADYATKEAANAANANAANAQTTANNAASAASLAQSTANAANANATNASKVATNYLSFNGNGLVVGDMTVDTLGNNVLIDNDSVDIRNGETVLASFGATEIELGADANSSSISLCGGVGTINAAEQAAGDGTNIMKMSAERLSHRGGTYVQLLSRNASGEDAFVLAESEGDGSHPTLTLKATAGSGHESSVTLDTNGRVEIDGAVVTDSWISVDGNASVGGTLGVTGAATLGSTLTVSGAGTFNGANTFTGSSTFNGEQKFSNASYCPTITDSAGGVGCAFKASRGLFNEALIDKLIMTGTTGKIPFYKYTGTSGGSMTGLTEVASIANDGALNAASATLSGTLKVSGTTTLGRLDAGTGYLSSVIYTGGKTSTSDKKKGCALGSNGALHLQATGSEIPIIKMYQGEVTTPQVKIACDTSGNLLISSTGAGLNNRAFGVNKVLWDGAYYMNASQTATLSETVSKQPNGIVLAFSAYVNGAAQNYDWNYFFVPKQHIASHAGAGVSFLMQTSNLSQIAVKYLYIYDNKITGYSTNEASATSSGISYKNNHYVLRHVIGV